MSAPTLLLVAHGSRDVRFAATARRVADAAAGALPGVVVKLAYLDLNEPLVGDVLASERGEVVVVPLLFGDGYHSKVDLPAIVADAHRRNPSLHATVTRVVGRHSPVPALVDRLAEALEPVPFDKLKEREAARVGVLMYAVGSSDAGSDASIIERGAELAGVLGAPVETVFATRLGPDGQAVRDAVDRLRSAGATHIAASPLFLSAGLLTERTARVLDEVAPGSTVAGPIGAHPALIDAISHLYLSAAAAPVA
ncbi:MAG: sirohydrochlorin chelatase [Gordonia sp. (in: high G+C Gram-positive bacteria)]|uniref:sirohydrochlorin chelatase n=1 Tax=Gordonia sp. (in: high G+C Gram-positive bacteria) TaxID=84139 RepID=UPI0039E4ACD3